MRIACLTCIWRVRPPHVRLNGARRSATIGAGSLFAPVNPFFTERARYEFAPLTVTIG